MFDDDLTADDVTRIREARAIRDGAAEPLDEDHAIRMIDAGCNEGLAAQTRAIMARLTDRERAVLAERLGYRMPMGMMGAPPVPLDDALKRCASETMRRIGDSMSAALKMEQDA